MRYLLVLFLIASVLTGCAVNVYTQYPYVDDSEGSGRVIIKLTDSIDGVNVRIDGALIVEDANTKRIEIKGVPVGTKTIEMIASGEGRTESILLEKTVIIKKNKDEIILITTPSHTTSYHILMLAAIALGWIIGGSL